MHKLNLRPHIHSLACFSLLWGLLSACMISPSLTPTPSLILATPDTTAIPITPQPNGQVCWEIPADVSMTDSWADVKAQNSPLVGGGGIAFGFGADDVPMWTMMGWKTFAMPPDEPTNGNFHIWLPDDGSNTGPIDLRFMVLLDELQLAGVLNGSLGKYYDVTLEPGMELTLTFHLPPLAPGIHDLNIVGLINAPAEPDPYGIIKSIHHRTTLLVGPTPLAIAKPYVQFPADGSVAKRDPLITALVPGLKTDLLLAWNWPETRLPISATESVDFYLYAGYAPVTNVNVPELLPPQKMPMAVLLFMDYQQIDIAPETLVLYGEVTDDTAYTRIGVTLPSPTTAGRHDILALRINYPGVPMCVLQGPFDGRIFPYSVDASRVAIEVTP